MDRGKGRRSCYLGVDILSDAWPCGPLGSTADLREDFTCYNQPSFALQYLQHQDLPGSVDMVVSILTMGYWPTYTPVEVHLPSEVMSILTL